MIFDALGANDELTSFLGLGMTQVCINTTADSSIVHVCSWKRIRHEGIHVEPFLARLGSRGTTVLLLVTDCIRSWSRFARMFQVTHTHTHTGAGNDLETDQAAPTLTHTPAHTHT